MNKPTAKLLTRILACPSCGYAELEHLISRNEEAQAGVNRDLAGVLICAKCKRWYPIEGGIVRMLPDNLRSRESDVSFIDKNREVFGTKRSEQLRDMQQSWSYSEEDFNSLISNHEVPMKTGGKNRIENLNHLFKFQEILRGVKAGGRGVCLEMGCGGGSHAAALIENLSELDYVGIDISLVRLGETKERIGNRDNTLLIQATMDALPFRDESFSAVYACSVLQYLDQPQDGIREARRVLKGGGLFTALDYNIKCYASALGLLKDSQKVDLDIDENMYEKMSFENLRRWMGDSGFSDFKIRYLLFLPGNLPLPAFVYRAINGILERTPFIRRFSIMLVTSGLR